jgi:hypothetical protein
VEKKESKRTVRKEEKMEVGLTSLPVLIYKLTPQIFTHLHFFSTIIPTPHSARVGESPQPYTVVGLFYHLSSMGELDFK